MMDRAPLPDILFADLAAALLARASALVPLWLPGGRMVGHEWVCGSLAGGKGGSCSVNLRTGRWKEFSGGEEGGKDLISLYAAIHGLSMARAAVSVAQENGLSDVAGLVSGTVVPVRAAPAPKPTAPVRESEGWVTVAPVPGFAPVPTFWHPHRKKEDLTHTFEYRAGDCLYGHVVRFRTSDGGKDTLPYTWCQSARDGASRWHWRTWDEPRPLYLPGKVLPSAESLARLTVVLVEGERKADVLHALLASRCPGVYLVASWPGGSSVWSKAAWGWLQGARTVLLWPDCDALREKPTVAERKACADDEALAVLKASKPLLPEAKQPGTKCMLGIGRLLLDLMPGVVVQLLRIPAVGSKPSGWDAADAIETDGWGLPQVLALFGTAYPLPPVDAPEPLAAAAGAGGAGGGGKKTDGPVDTNGGGLGGDAGDDDLAAGGKSMPRWLVPFFDAHKKRWLTSRKLVIAALTHDPQLQGLLGVNQLSNNLEARSNWPWPHGAAGPVKGVTDLALARYLSNVYGLPSINRQAIMEAIETVAHESPFHPIQDYLRGLNWDGKTRIDQWLVYALGESRETLAPAVYEYLCLVGRYWLLGMVNRVMEPGCKFDYCVVLEGPGGLGKSTLVEVLASTPWFSDTHFDISRGKEGQEQVQGLWLYEIAELSQFGKAEIQLIKAFVSAKVDRYRPSYGRVVESYPRQCVMVGTTNERTYLRDRTGNRRFWPVPVVKRVNNPWVRERRDQLLAEAFELYMQGAAYTPSPEEEARLFVPMQESRLVETAVMGELLAVLTRSPQAAGIGSIVNELTEFVTLPQLVLALGVDAAKSTPALEAQVRGWMEHEGWEKVKRQINGVRAWGYARPSNWPVQESEDNGTPEQGAANTQDDDEAPF